MESLAHDPGAVSRSPILSEAELWVVDACRPRGDADPALEVPLGLDWDAALRVAARNRVTSILCDALARVEIPADAQGVVKELQANGVLRSAMARRELVELGGILGGAGVETLLYKGLDLEERFYPSRRRRLFGDLDLIVRNGDVGRADEALRAAGYRPPDGAPPLDYFRKYHLHREYERPGAAYPVELHWAVDSPYAARRVGLGEIFERAVPSTVDGLRVPHAADAMFLVLLHLAKHIGLCASLPSAEARIKAVLDAGGWLWIMDGVYGLARLDPREGERLIDMASAFGSEAELAAAARLIEDALPGALDGALNELLSKEARPSLVTRLLYPDLVSGGAVTARGQARRRFMLEPLPHLTFRPVQVVELAFPHAPRARRGRAR